MKVYIAFNNQEDWERLKTWLDQHEVVYEDFKFATAVEFKTNTIKTTVDLRGTPSLILVAWLGDRIEFALGRILKVENN